MDEEVKLAAKTWNKLSCLVSSSLAEVRVGWGGIVGALYSDAAGGARDTGWVGRRAGTVGSCSLNNDLPRTGL